MAERRRIAALTTGRQDYGILRSTLLLLRGDARFELSVWVGGMHLSSEFGHTVDSVVADAMPITERLDFLKSKGDQTRNVHENGSPPASAMESAQALVLVAGALKRRRPDALLLLGDRYETLAAGVAATLTGVPIAHLHGGEESEGAIDNALRHALTKLAHLHLVSHPKHAQRVRQMGEEPDAVVVVGAPGLDNLHRDDLPDRAQLESGLGIMLEPPVVMVTQHPTTLGSDPTAEVAALAHAMEQVPATYVITQPNSDAGGDAIRELWKGWVRGRERVVLVDALGEKRFWGLLRIANAALGNSSSGIVEAPAAGLAVVNVGDRQRGRLHSVHITDVPAEPDAIQDALAHALLPATRERLRRAASPYPVGAAAPRVVEALAQWRIPSPARKRFVDIIPRARP